MYKMNYKNKAEGITFLKSIESSSIKVCFFDPQYRGVLDKLQYGNEGKQRGKDRSSLPQMDFTMIQNFFKEIERILLPDGYLFLWVDKFHLVEGVKDWFKDLPSLECVDMITWDKDKMGMGYRSRRISEYLVVVQKAPRHAKSTWTIHNIPDVWKEKTKKYHPHSKPIELQKRLIEATTVKNDIVIDPCAGGYSVMEACKLCNRNFYGCDLVFGGENNE